MAENQQNPNRLSDDYVLLLEKSIAESEKTRKLNEALLKKLEEQSTQINNMTMRQNNTTPGKNKKKKSEEEIPDTCRVRYCLGFIIIVY